MKIAVATLVLFSLSFLPAVAIATSIGSPEYPTPFGPGDGLPATFSKGGVTFLATSIDYPHTGGTSVGDGISIADFTAGGATHYTGDTTQNLAGSDTTFTGFIVLPAGDTNLSVGSDDGFSLTIGGQLLGSSGDRGFGYTDMTATAASAGAFPITLTFHEDGGNTGLEFTLGFDGTGPIATSAVLFSQLPEPSTFVLGGLGLVGLLVAARRRNA